MMDIKTLHETIELIKTQGKGILAADESSPTIKKRFEAIGIDSTEDSRRRYRELLFTTPNLEKYISGVICFEETLFQKASNGKTLSQILIDKGIVPGIKVDKGLVALPNTQDEKTTQGLDGLPERLASYQEAGARFAKWRVVFKIAKNMPSQIAIETNAEILARYAAICQNQSIVPIVEPEILMEGDHSLERCALVTERVHHAVFNALFRHKVIFELIILKPNMVLAGKDCIPQPSVEEVAAKTIEMFRCTVPAAIPSINFLSGGQDDITATKHLNAINKIPGSPWYLSFSYGRALQAPCLKAWQGKDENKEQAQAMLLKRARLNSLAVLGKYENSME